MIKELRELTGAGILDCKEALQEADGDQEKAIHILRRKGLEVASKKAARATAQGLIQAYIHHDGRCGALVELNCETDFVTRTNDFRQLAQDLAMQVAAMDPQFISPDEIPEGGNGDPKELCLLLQSFIKDEKTTVGDLVTEVIRKTGENVRVHRFARFELGRPLGLTHAHPGLLR
jgi:elongation factor Ts